jgi:hypothetical protein
MVIIERELQIKKPLRSEKQANKEDFFNTTDIPILCLFLKNIPNLSLLLFEEGILFY